jgi:hypothetical protein
VPKRLPPGDGGPGAKDGATADVVTPGPERARIQCPVRAIACAGCSAPAVSIIADGEPSYPTALNNQTGPATYAPMAASGMPPRLTGSSPPVAGATLRPGENILIRIPFRTPGCWDTGRSVVGSFWVTTKFLWWTHTFAVSWTPPGNLDDRAIVSQLPDPNGSLCPGSLVPAWEIAESTPRRYTTEGR